VTLLRSSPRGRGARAGHHARRVSVTDGAAASAGTAPHVCPSMPQAVGRTLGASPLSPELSYGAELQCGSTGRLHTASPHTIVECPIPSPAHNRLGWSSNDHGVTNGVTNGVTRPRSIQGGRARLSSTAARACPPSARPSLGARGWFKVALGLLVQSCQAMMR
jgi:hypothetical protein